MGNMQGININTYVRSFMLRETCLKDTGHVPDHSVHALYVYRIVMQLMPYPFAVTPIVDKDIL